MTWNELSEADKRRWALEQAGVAIRCGSADVESAIATARKILNFINGQETPQDHFVFKQLADEECIR